MKRGYSVNLNGIDNLAKKMAAELKGGEVLALIGPLGSGKTTFTKTLAKQLGVNRRITSPTFVLMNNFNARLKNGKKIKLYHLDLYRTKNFSEVKNLGLTEIWTQAENLTVIEWANKIKRHLPKKTITVKFQYKK